MGLLTQRKEHRVPDLSRYDHYYQQRDDYGKSRQLSASAAYAASRSREGPIPVQQRSYSLVQPSQTRKVIRTRRRASSRGPQDVREAPRVSYNRVRPQESSGRTKSITRKTIRRINGVDYVETITTTPLEDEDNANYFNEFSDPIDAYVESEQRPVRRVRRIKKTVSSSPRSGRSQRSPASPQRSPRGRRGGDEYQYEDDEVAGLDYGEAEPIQRTVSPVVRRVTRSRPVRSKSTRTVRRVQPSQPSPTETQGGKKRMTEQEMYAKALEIAQRNVYKNSDFPPEVLNGAGNQQEDQGYSKMGQRSLRNGAGRSKKRFNIFHKDRNVRPPVAPLQPLDVPPRLSRASRVSRVSSLDNRLEQSMDRTSARSASTASRRNLSDEEMYAQALAISQSKAQRSSEEFEAGTQPLDLGGLERPVRSPQSNAPSFFTPAQTINENFEDRFEDAHSRVEQDGGHSHPVDSDDHYDFEETESAYERERQQRHEYSTEQGDEVAADEVTEAGSGSRSVPESQDGSELVPESVPESETESQLVPKSEPGSELESKLEAEREFQEYSESGAEHEGKTKLGQEVERKAVDKGEAESEGESETEPEGDYGNQPERVEGYEPETEPEVESKERHVKRDVETALEYHPEEVSEAYEMGADEIRKNRLSSLSRNGETGSPIRTGTVYSRPSMSRNEEAALPVKSGVASKEHNLVHGESLAPPRKTKGYDDIQDEDVVPPRTDGTRSNLVSSSNTPDNKFYNYIASPEEVAAGDLRASNLRTSPDSPSHLQMGGKNGEPSMRNSAVPSSFASEAEVGGIGAPATDSSPVPPVANDSPGISTRKHKGFSLSRFKAKKRNSANKPNEEYLVEVPKGYSTTHLASDDSRIGYASQPVRTQTPVQNYQDLVSDSRPKGGKFKNIINKMVEFGAENSGYQLSNEEKEQRAAELRANGWSSSDGALPRNLGRGVGVDGFIEGGANDVAADRALGNPPGNAAASGLAPTNPNINTSHVATLENVGRRDAGSMHPWRRNLQSLRTDNAGNPTPGEAPVARNFLGAHPPGGRDDASSNYEEYAAEGYNAGYADGLRDSQYESGQERAKKINGTSVPYGDQRNVATSGVGLEEKFRQARDGTLEGKVVSRAENEAQDRAKEQKGGLFKKLFKK